MKPYERPSDEACNSAAQKFEMAANYLSFVVCDQDWLRALGHLQDGLAELGFDLVPLKQPAPATAEALFDGAAYAASKGQ